MIKNILISFLLLILVSAPNISYSATQIIFDGKSDEYVYVIISIDNVSDMKIKDEEINCDISRCTRWTARLWDGSNPETIVYAGAVYNISDGLSQSMTFNVPSGTNYNTVEVIGMNYQNQEIAYSIKTFLYNIVEEIIDFVEVVEESIATTSITSDLSNGETVTTSIDGTIIQEDNGIADPDLPQTEEESDGIVDMVVDTLLDVIGVEDEVETSAPLIEDLPPVNENEDIINLPEQQEEITTIIDPVEEGVVTSEF